MIRIISFFLIFLAGCIHQAKYVPEVGSPGSVAAKNGVIYSIPPVKPRLKLELVSLGINSDKLLKIRMYFVRTDASGGSADEFLNMNEQTLVLPDTETKGHEVHPSHVYASAKKRPLIALSDRKKQVVEFMFPLDPTEGDKFPYFQLKWKIHYKDGGADKTEEQLARFDRIDKTHIQQGVGFYDPDYPLDDLYLLPMGSEWLGPDFLFW